MRGKFKDDTLGHLGLEQTPVVFQTLQRLPLLRGGAQCADKDNRLAQVRSDVHGMDRDERAAGRYFTEDDHAQFALENFGHADHAVFHLGI